MHHKRKRAKNRRAGCLLCKLHKVNGQNKYKTVSIRGFSTIRKMLFTKKDMQEDIS